MLSENYFTDWRCNELRNRIEYARKQNMAIVVANGVFDILHLGHLALFSYAREGHKADTGFRRPSFVIVAINSDESARTVKGPGRPFLPEMLRLRLIAALRDVDIATLFSETTPGDLLQSIKPDVLVKGGDARGTLPVGHAHARKVAFSPAHEMHTTKLAWEIAVAHGQTIRPRIVGAAS